MRKAVTLVAASVLVTGIAAAQMKVKPTAPAQKAPLVVPGAQQQQAAVQSVRRVTTAEAARLVKANEAVLVDVRSQEQFNKGHIRGAVSIPGSQLMQRLKELPAGKLIITYCA
jgi:3-mercaptopyruvate sulfurtransferase SseA